MSIIWENLCSMLKGARTKTASKKMHFESKEETNNKIIHHLNCSITQGFSALRKAVTTHVKKNYDNFFTFTPISCWHVTRISRHSVRLINEWQSLHSSRSIVVCRNFLGLWLLKHWNIRIAYRQRRFKFPRRWKLSNQWLW